MSNVPQNILRSATFKGKTIFAMVGPKSTTATTVAPRGLLPMSSTGASRNGTAIGHDIRPDKSMLHKGVNWAKWIKFY